MLSDYRKNSASTPEPPPMRNSGLHSGLCTSVSEDIEYAHSNSNRKLDPSIDEPPPYEMASNLNDQVGILLQNMPPQSAEGQPPAGQGQPAANWYLAYSKPAIQPAEENRFWRFCKYLQPSPLLTLNFTFPTLNFTFNLNFKYIILAILAFGLWSWVFWGPSKTP